MVVVDAVVIVGFLVRVVVVCKRAVVPRGRVSENTLIVRLALRRVMLVIFPLFRVTSAAWVDYFTLFFMSRVFLAFRTWAIQAASKGQPGPTWSGVKSLSRSGLNVWQ